MSQLLAVLAIITIVAAGTWFQYRLSGGRMWKPLWIAFSTTAMAITLIGAGSIGFTLGRHDRFVNGTAWTGSVIWSEVGMGVAAAVVAAFFWRRGLRQG